MEEKFKTWLKLRELSKDKFGDRICYCGQIEKFSCADPSNTNFKDSIERGVLDVNDANNGWKSVEF